MYTQWSNNFGGRFSAEYNFCGSSHEWSDSAARIAPAKKSRAWRQLAIRIAPARAANAPAPGGRSRRQALHESRQRGGRIALPRRFSPSLFYLYFLSVLQMMTIHSNLGRCNTFVTLCSTPGLRLCEGKSSPAKNVDQIRCALECAGEPHESRRQEPHESVTTDTTNCAFFRE